MATASSTLLLNLLFLRLSRSVAAGVGIVLLWVDAKQLLLVRLAEKLLLQADLGLRQDNSSGGGAAAGAGRCSSLLFWLVRGGVLLMLGKGSLRDASSCFSRGSRFPLLLVHRVDGLLHELINVGRQAANATCCSCWAVARRRRLLWWPLGCAVRCSLKHHCNLLLLLLLRAAAVSLMLALLLHPGSVLHC